MCYKMEPKLYYNKNKKKYYYEGDPNCSKCDCELPTTSFFAIITYKHTEIKDGFKKKSLQAIGKVLCFKCLDTIKDEPLITESVEVKRVMVGEETPKNSFLVLIRPDHAMHDVRNLSGTLTTIAAVSSKEIKSDDSNIKIIDHTKHANKESLEGAQIGLSPDKVDCKDCLLNDSEADQFLLEMKTTKPLKKPGVKTK